MAVPLSVSTTCIPVQNMPMGDATKARCPVLRIYIHWFTCASDSRLVCPSDRVKPTFSATAEAPPLSYKTWGRKK